jgi:aspartyl-tRNA(Asn)/glutamyl-tRNA(Gln) amidotransferase subunit A
LVAYASSLDQVGPIARTAADAALLLEVLAGHDKLDSTSANRAVPSYTATVGKPLEGLRIGWVREHFGEGLDGEVEAAVREALNVLSGLGVQVEDVSLPHSRYGIATYYIIAPSEASSNLARYDGVHYGHRTDEKRMLEELEAERQRLTACLSKNRQEKGTGTFCSADREETGQHPAASQNEPVPDGFSIGTKSGDAAALDDLDSPLVRMYCQSRSEGFGDEVKRRIMLGTYALSAGYYDAYYLRALKVRRLIRDDYTAAFGTVDLIAGPTTPNAAFRIGEKTADPLAMYLEDLYTVTANLAGVAAISIPCGFTSDGRPIGLQLQAPPFEEERLLRAAAMFQRATDWHTRRPQLP